MGATGRQKKSGGDFPWIADGLRHLAVPVADLTMDPANARLHPERNLAAIAASLHRFGQRKPIVVQRSGMIVRAGNGTLEAARSLGWSHVAALVVDEADIEATAFAIADNRTAELAEWDKDVLGALLNGLPDDAAAAAGFTRDEIDDLLSDVAGDGGDDEDTSAQLGNLTYQVIVECRDADHQAEVLAALEAKGETCRALML